MTAIRIWFEECLYGACNVRRLVERNILNNFIKPYFHRMTLNKVCEVFTMHFRSQLLHYAGIQLVDPLSFYEDN